MLSVIGTGHLADRVVDLSLVAGAVAFIAGVIISLSEWAAESQLRKQAKRVAIDLAKPPATLGDDSPIKAQGGLDSGINAIANLAKALKELDRSTRLLVVSLAFFLISAVGAIAGAVSRS